MSAALLVAAVAGWAVMFGASQTRRPDFIKNEHLEFLDKLLKEHSKNVLNWRYLRDVFSDLTPEQSQQLIIYWGLLQGEQS